MQTVKLSINPDRMCDCERGETMRFKFEGCKVLEERALALCVEVPDLLDSPVWIPKSAIHDDSECYKADTDGDLVVFEWFAESRGWL